MLSYRYWQHRFNGDPAAVGKQVNINNLAFTVVGVTPPGFFGLQVGSPIDLTVPMRLSGNRLTAKQNWWFSVIGRIRPERPHP